MKRATMVSMGLLALLPAGVGAYTTNGWWDQDVVGMYASNVSFPSGSPYRGAISEAFDIFNRNPSQFRVNEHFGDGNVSRTNYQSEIWATNSWEWQEAGGVELSRYGSGNKIIASDILFDARRDDWTLSEEAVDLSAYDGDGRSFRAALVHELGHTAGLGHESDEYSMMGETYQHMHRWKWRARPYVGEDAGDGLVAIYGRRSGASIEDLSVAHFRWVTDDGEYAAHGFTTMRRVTNGLDLPSSEYSGMNRYYVSLGESTDVQFTYENNGETDQTGVSVGFYISDNDLVTTADRLIGTGSFNLSRGDVATRVDRLTIPADLEVGRTYYLGVIVDRTGELPEIDEDNNRAFHIIYVNP